MDTRDVDVLIHWSKFKSSNVQAKSHLIANVIVKVAVIEQDESHSSWCGTADEEHLKSKVKIIGVVQKRKRTTMEMETSTSVLSSLFFSRDG